MSNIHFHCDNKKYKMQIFPHTNTIKRVDKNRNCHLQTTNRNLSGACTKKKNRYYIKYNYFLDVYKWKFSNVNFKVNKCRTSRIITCCFPHLSKTGKFGERFWFHCTSGSGTKIPEIETEKNGCIYKEPQGTADWLNKKPTHLAHVREFSTTKNVIGASLNHCLAEKHKLFNNCSKRLFNRIHVPFSFFYAVQKATGW